MSAKWSEQSFKGTVADADVLLIIDSEAGPVDNKQVLFSTLKLASQTPWVGDIDAATFNLDNLESVDLNNSLGTNPIISALQSASESTVVLGSNFLVSSGYIDMAEIVTPANPATDVGRLYVKDDGGGVTNLFFRDSLGTETDIISGAGGSPLTTKGDLFGYDTDDNRIPVGTDGQVLTADSVEALGVKWEDASGGGETNDPALFFGTSGLDFFNGDSNIFKSLNFRNDTDQESEVQFTVPVDTNFSNFVLTVEFNDLDEDFTLTLRVNGVSSSAVITVPAATTGTFASSASIDLTKNDLVNWIMNDGGATSGELENGRISFSMPSGSGGEDPAAFFASDNLNFSNGDTNIYFNMSFQDDTDQEEDIQFTVPANSSFSNFVISVPSNDLDEDFTLTLRVNGVSTSSITVPSSSTGTFSSSSSTILSKGDLINWEVNDGGASIGEIQDSKISFSMPFNSRGDSTPLFFGNNQLFFSFGDTDIFRTLDFDTNSNTESEVQFTVPVDTNFSNFMLFVPTNDLDEDFTLTLRVNGVSTDAVITVPSGETGIYYSPVSVPLLADDLVNWIMNDNGAASGEIQEARISFSMPTNTGGGTIPTGGGP